MKPHNPQHKVILDQLLLARPGVRAGHMFGYPAYYAHKKLCICLYEDGVGIKLPASAVARLVENDANASHFQPLGKPKMSQWVQVNLTDSEGYRAYASVFGESIAFLLKEQGKKA